jgi:hypothetical protein
MGVDGSCEVELKFLSEIAAKKMECSWDADIMRTKLIA